MCMNCTIMGELRRHLPTCLYLFTVFAFMVYLQYVPCCTNIFTNAEQENGKRARSGERQGITAVQWGHQACVLLGARLFAANHDHLPAERARRWDREREERRTLRNTVELRQDDGGWRGCRMESSGCSIYSGMDGAAVWAAQRADDRQHQPDQFQ